MNRLIARYPLTAAFLAANAWMTAVVWFTTGVVR